MVTHTRKLIVHVSKSFAVFLPVPSVVTPRNARLYEKMIRNFANLNTLKN